jgi:hypothetical protein
MVFSPPSVGVIEPDELPKQGCPPPADASFLVDAYGAQRITCNMRTRKPRGIKNEAAGLKNRLNIEITRIFPHNT